MKVFRCPVKDCHFTAGSQSSFNRHNHNIRLRVLMTKVLQEILFFFVMLKCNELGLSPIMNFINV